jgi:hypothetical protein
MSGEIIRSEADIGDNNYCAVIRHLSRLRGEAGPGLLFEVAAAFTPFSPSSDYDSSPSQCRREAHNRPHINATAQTEYAAMQPSPHAACIN